MISHGLKSVEVEKDLGIMIISDLKCSRQCEYACSKANRVIGMIRRTITYKEPKIMSSLYKTLVRPHVEYCSCAWNPSYKKDKELLEKTQHRYTKMIINIQGKTYEESLKSVGLWTLEERQNRQDIIEVFKMHRGYSSVALHELFEIDTNNKHTRAHSCKLKRSDVQGILCGIFFE